MTSCCEEEKDIQSNKKKYSNAAAPSIQPLPNSDWQEDCDFSAFCLSFTDLKRADLQLPARTAIIKWHHSLTELMSDKELMEHIHLSSRPNCYVWGGNCVHRSISEWSFVADYTHNQYCLDFFLFSPIFIAFLGYVIAMLFSFFIYPLLSFISFWFNFLFSWECLKGEFTPKSKIHICPHTCNAICPSRLFWWKFERFCRYGLYRCLPSLKCNGTTSHLAWVLKA